MSELEADIEKNNVTVYDLHRNLSDKNISKSREIAGLIEREIIDKNATDEEAIMISRPYALDILRIHAQYRLEELAGV